ncbi:MAG: ABC transporter ATP-binding protein [Acidimicrobiales bacterium]
MNQASQNGERLHATTASDVLLAVSDLRTHFATPAGLVKAVDGVSFDLKRGTTLGVVGESGSGKTVLARSIMRLNIASNVLSSGSVLYEGQDLMTKSNAQMRDLWGIEMAMVFQDPMTSLNPVVKVGRQVTEHLRYHLGVSKDEARQTAVELLRSVRIPEPEERFDVYPHQLSGGMRQRVSIAIALACGPKLLFADEPTTALDVTVQHQILNLLRQQQRERFMSMILVTHDLGVVAGRADEIMVMYAGKPVEKATTKNLFADMKHPYTQGLLNSIPKVSNPKHTRLQAITGRPPDLINPPKGCSFSPRCPYAQPKCFEEEPSLTPASTPDHSFACWFPVGTPESAAAFESNLAAGNPVTLAAAGRAMATEEMAL